MINVLAIGDIIGKPGRLCLKNFLPKIIKDNDVHFTIVNGENAAGGFGMTNKIYNSFKNDFKVDCITMGNHWKDKTDIYNVLEKENVLILPANMKNTKEHSLGFKIFNTKNGIKIAVINLVGTIFMDESNECPFKKVDQILSKIAPNTLKIVDIHAEATSEKQALANYLSSKVSLIYGTHTHTPTADERIIDNFTAFLTDIGMTGAYDSVIGMDKYIAINRMTKKSKEYLKPAQKNLWIWAILVNIDEQTGKCNSIKRIKQFCEE